MSYARLATTADHVANPATDRNVEHVRELLKARAAAGLKKYGVTTERTDLTLRQWVQHALEECCDQAVYLARILHELDNPPPAPAVSPALLSEGICAICRASDHLRRVRLSDDAEARQINALKNPTSKAA